MSLKFPVLLKLPVFEVILEVGFLGSYIVYLPSNALPLTNPVSLRLLVRGLRDVGTLKRRDGSCLEIVLSSFGEIIP